jgi:hypothetical protein
VVYITNNNTSQFNTPENRKLLIKYLKKYAKENLNYNNTKANEYVKTVMINNQANLFGVNSVASSLGAKSIEFFCLYYLQDTFVQKPNNKARKLDKLHYSLWQELEQMFILDKWDKEEFILPRGSSKTTTVDMALSTYLHCYKISRYTIVLGKRKKDAYNFIEDTKTALQNPYIVNSFGKLVDKKNRTVNMEEIELSNNTKIQAFSSDTSVRGTYYSCKEGRYRPTLYLLDDVISKDDILTEGAKQKMVDKFYNEMLEGGDEAVYRNGKKLSMATKFIVLGTPLAQDCFINTIRKDIDFKVFHRSVVDFDFDEYIENNDYWQEFKSIIFDDKIKDKQERKDKADKYYHDNIDSMKFNTIWNDKFLCNKLVLKYLNNRPLLCKN